MEIPYQELSREALQAVIEEFITREGTDYGMQHYSLRDKVEQVQKQLASGKVIINYDADSESCSLVRVK